MKTIILLAAVSSSFISQSFAKKFSAKEEDKAIEYAIKKDIPLAYINGK